MGNDPQTLAGMRQPPHLAGVFNFSKMKIEIFLAHCTGRELYQLKQIVDRYYFQSNHSFTQQKLCDTWLSSRTLNVLRWNDYDYVHDLTKATEKELLQLRGLGNTGIVEIKNLLKTYHLSLKSS
jgi:DNA-directed RNA polymerase alpha subunit